MIENVKLKEQLKKLILSYNNSKSKKKKSEIYKQIMEIEEKLK